MNIILVGSDIEDPEPRFDIIRQPLHGVLGDLSGNNLVYTPVADYLGGDSFTFRVTDSDGRRSRVATVRLTAIEPPIQTRNKVMLCGSSQRPLSDFAINKPVTSSCDPDNDTQAMFVTRSGASSIEPGTLQNYLTNGGIVITEYGISHVVYNKAFDTQFGRAGGSRNGQCQDEVMPVYQKSNDDIFWQDNTFVSIGSISGCGYDLSHLPNITSLGGWTSESVQLAYTDIGLGRLWLVEADWQDNDRRLTVGSQKLLNYMTTHRADGIAVQ